MSKIVSEAGSGEPEVSVIHRLGRVKARLLNRLREDLRYSDVKLTLYAALAGTAAGICVRIMSALVSVLHHMIFKVSSFTGVSGALAIEPVRVLLGPALGGIAVSLSILAHAHWRKRTIIDPIEANALHGGRMSLVDSLIYPTGWGLLSGLRPAIHRSEPDLPRASASLRIYAARNCAQWWGAAWLAP